MAGEPHMEFHTGDSLEKRGMRVEPNTPASRPHVGVDHIEMTIPARPEYIAVIRLVTAGIGGRMAFSFDDIEDLKIAVGEICTVAVLAGARQVLLRFDIAPDSLKIRVAHAGKPTKGPGEETELGMFLVRCLMDEVRSGRDGPRHVTWLTKRLQK